MTMTYRRLGRSGLQISAITLGTLPFGGHQRASVGNVSVDEARYMLDMALDAGVNLIDTADVYGYGRSEEVVGRVIQGRRDKLLLATKCRAKVGPEVNDEGLSRHHVMRAIDDSLRRLNVDYVDLYQMHGPDPNTPLEETVDALNDLVVAGKVRYLGCSNFSAWQVMKALSIADVTRAHRFVSQQIYYSAIGREAENELIPLSIDQGIGVLVWSPLATGLLGGRHKRSDPDAVAKLEGWFEPPVPDPGFVYDVLDALSAVASEQNATIAQVALAYVLARTGVTSLVVGPRSRDHLATSLEAVNVELSTEQLQQLDAATARPIPYPQWHQRRNGWDVPNAALVKRGDPDPPSNSPLEAA
jgi:aryl-alcohol dehydrogenase-like predicted oxidoreductase